MSIKYVTAQVKSRESIESTLKDVDTIGNKTVGTYGKTNIEISEHLWGLCDTLIKVRSTKRETHEYDYSHLMSKQDEDGCTYMPYVYFMEDWLEPVEESEDV